MVWIIIGGVEALQRAFILTGFHGKSSCIEGLRGREYGLLCCCGRDWLLSERNVGTIVALAIPGGSGGLG